MYLEKIAVENYRSISSITMSRCLDFNVLIGRNNSGKSNILTSIDAFFSAAKPTIVNRSSSLGAEIDFFEKDLSRSIAIEATLRLSAQERERLLSDISEERPQ